MWINNVYPCIREKKTYLCVQSSYLLIIYLLLFHNILLYRNVNSESIEIFFHIKLASLLCKAIIKQLFVQLCCCFGDMIRMFYIIDRHLKCIVHLKKNIRCLQSLSIIQYFENMLDILSLWHKKNISKMKHKRRTQTKNTC